MKIQTADGKVFDIPEENIEGFLSEYETARKFEEANKQLANIDRQINPGGKYGLERNFLRGLVPGASRVEGAIRSIPSGFQDYSKYRDWARKSADEYAYANPDKALAATLTGAFGPALATVIFSRGTGTSVAAGKMIKATADVRNAINVSKNARLLERSLRGAAGGAGLGALYGFMDEPSESLADRLGTATGSAIVGGGVGGATQPVLSLLGTTGNAISRIAKGASKEALPAEQVERFMLNSGVLQNTPEQALNAEILRKGSAAGALDIYKPVYNMNATLEAASTMRKPELLTNLTTPTASAADIIRAGRTPQLDLASERFAKFVESVKDTPGQGLVANEFMKRNPVAKKILSVEPSLKDVPVGSFEWWQKAEKTLNNSLPKNVDTDRLVGRRASILKSIDDISATREMIHPGTTKANLDYAVGKAWEETGTKTLADRLKYIANIPTETSPALSSQKILEIGFKPWQRGRARELIQKGELYLKPNPATQLILEGITGAAAEAGRLH